MHKRPDARKCGGCERYNAENEDVQEVLEGKDDFNDANGEWYIKIKHKKAFNKEKMSEELQIEQREENIQGQNSNCSGIEKTDNAKINEVVTQRENDADTPKEESIAQEAKQKRKVRQGVENQEVNTRKHKTKQTSKCKSELRTNTRNNNTLRIEDEKDVLKKLSKDIETVNNTLKVLPHTNVSDLVDMLPRVKNSCSLMYQYPLSFRNEAGEILHKPFTYNMVHVVIAYQTFLKGNQSESATK